MGFSVDNEREMYLKKHMYKVFLNRAGLKAPELWERIQDKYGINASYKTIAQAINGNNSWKLLYAWAICTELGVTVDSLFELKNVDEVKREKMRMYRAEKKDASKLHDQDVAEG